MKKERAGFSKFDLDVKMVRPRCGPVRFDLDLDVKFDVKVKIQKWVKYIFASFSNF